MATVGILMAAGRGRRFDPLGQRNKLLQMLPSSGGSGEPVVVASARKLLGVLPQVVAVVPPALQPDVSPDHGGVGALLASIGCTVTVCPDADSGMAASLTHAIRHALDVFSPVDALLVALGDMPRVAPSTLQALADALAGGVDIVVPVMAGRRGNPVGFGRVHLDALLALRGDEGARRLLHTFPVTEVVVDDPGIFQDIDTPADL
jgi:molybdenum cofactor cytidylyltransferase